MVGDRVIELIAGLAAVIFIAAMIWTDLAPDALRRQERQDHFRPAQYAAALTVQEMGRISAANSAEVHVSGCTPSSGDLLDSGYDRRFRIDARYTEVIG